MAQIPVNAHWRDSARTPRFFMVDAYAVLPLFLFLLHIRYWTFGIAVTACLFFAILERFGYKIPVFMRVIRTTLSGKNRYSRVWWKLFR